METQIIFYPTVLDRYFGPSWKPLVEGLGSAWGAGMAFRVQLSSLALRLNPKP